MVNAHDVPASELIDAVAKELKNSGKITPPQWVTFAKSGAHKERPIVQPDFWYVRGASILRKIYMHGTLGTQRLRTEYGGRKQRGSKPTEHRDAGGSIIRKLLQQLEAAGYLRKVKVGRVMTPAGQKMLDNIAYAVSKKPKTHEEAVAQVVEKAKNFAEKLPEQSEKKPEIKQEKPKREKKQPAQAPAQAPKPSA